MTSRNAVLVLLALGFAGCNRPVPSTAVPLAEIHVDARVLAKSGAATEVEVRLRRSGRFSRRTVKLSGGDRLVAEMAGQRFDLTQAPDREGSGRYQAVVPNGGAETPVSILVLRRDGSSTIVSAGALPLPFEVAELPRSPSASKELEVRWFPVSRDPMEIVVKGPCVSTSTDWTSEDTGRLVIPPGTLRPPVMGSGNCWVDLSVARSREGTVDRGFHPGSSFLVRQVRTLRMQPVR
jgi:hypothetical protein